MKKITVLALLFMLTALSEIQGQTVIGGATYPVEGALLDLKEYKANTDNVTANKGLLLPRVKLTSLTSLLPLVQTETQATKNEHIGLQVYHIGDEELPAGVKVWNGEMWTGGASNGPAPWIYMPAFPIQMHKTAEQKVYLYAEYKKQIGDISAMEIWDESEVKFVVTAYDATTFSTVPTVKIENGKQYLVYKAIPNNMTASSYLNIIIVKI